MRKIHIIFRASVRAGIAVAACAALASCIDRESAAQREDLPSCNRSAEPVLLADLPMGACSPADNACAIDTREPCDDGSPGPLVHFTCSCEQRQWRCAFEIDSLEDACVIEPGLDAGSPSSALDGEGREK
jgi:hypothetical protein